MASIYNSYSNPPPGRFSSSAPLIPPRDFTSSIPLTDAAVLLPSSYRPSSSRLSSNSEHVSHAHYRHRLNTYPFFTPTLLHATSPQRPPAHVRPGGMPLPMPPTQSNRFPIRHHARHGLRAREKERAAAYSGQTADELSGQKRAYARQTSNGMGDVPVNAAFAIVADTNAADADAANILVNMMNDFGVGVGKKDEDEEVDAEV